MEYGTIRIKLDELLKESGLSKNKLPVYILKRYLLLLAGLLIMAFGLSFSIKANLGTSPISCVPYVISLFSHLTVGTATNYGLCTNTSGLLM